MDRYVTTTELKQNLKRVKEYARAGIVHVLENGHEGYVLCSSEIYEEKLRDCRERAVWEAEAKEACREGLFDESQGNVSSLTDMLPWCGRPTKNLKPGEGAESLRISHTAARDMTLEYDGTSRSELTAMLLRIAEDPAFGLSVEFNGAPKGVRKVLVPPYDILYRWDVEANTILVIGLVRSLKIPSGGVL